MSEAINTEKWEVVDDEDSAGGAVFVSKERGNDSTIFLFRTYDLNLAYVVAEALNINEETGKTPRQLAEQVKVLREALLGAASTIAWQCHGDCRAFGDAPIPSANQAIEHARAALAATDWSKK